MLSPRFIARKSRKRCPIPVGEAKRSADDIKRIYDAEQVAHVATQRLIDKGGRATKAVDEQAARAVNLTICVCSA